MTFSLAIRTQDELAAAGIEAARDQALARVVAALDLEAKDLSAGVPLSEQLSWGRKAAAADAYVHGMASDAQVRLLQIEADEVRCSIGELAKTILDRAEVHAALTARLTGLRRTFAKRIQEAPDADDVQLALAEFEAALTRR